MDQIVQVAFRADQYFAKARDYSFGKFINACDYSPAHLAYYADHILRKNNAGHDKGEISNILSKIIRVFVLLHQRDIFITTYTKMLSKRLLNKTYSALENEELMVEKLKIECGPAITDKIVKMFNDIQISKDTNEEFKQRHGQVIEGINFSAEVLTNGYWPSDRPPICEIPKKMRTCTNMFQIFYMTKRPNTRLEWLF